MSKLIAGTAFVLLSGATVTGGVLLFGKNGKTDQQTPEAPVQQTANQTYDANLADTLDKFKSSEQEKWSKEKCITGLFSDNVDSTEPSEEATTTDLAEGFFGTEANKKTEGCLVVNWNKDTYNESSNKWKGTFRFLWAVKGESKGFFVFLLGTPSSTDATKEIKWSGFAYTLEHEGTAPSKIWKPKKKHEITTTENDAKAFKKPTDSATNKFPQPGEELTEVSSKTFWGWFEQTDNMDNICGASDCTGTPTKTSMQGYWDWAGNYGTTTGTGQKTLSSWTKSLETWWPETFGDKFKVKDVTDKQVGTWTKRIYPSISPSNVTQKTT